MKQLGAHKKLIFLAAIAGMFFVALPSVTHAGVGDFISGIAYTVVTDIAFIASYIIGLVLGVLVAIEAWAISLVLQLSMNIVNSPPVKFGVPVTTYIANLGFVVAIVVMAIMTILRRESYGLKQTIAKLIFGAILVNFSLVIAGAILNFSDQLSIAFLNQVDPGAEEGSFNSLATSLAGAFNPQAFLIGDDEGFEDLIEENPGEGIFGSIGAVFMPLVSVLFSTFALLFIVIVMLSLVVLLLIRYVYIAGLLIAMPLAWVAWIFPVTNHHFSDWWNKFFKQVFFAPIVIFGIWLTIKTGELMGSGGYGAAVYESDNPIGDAAGSFFAPIVRQLLDAIVLCGILVMGMVAASKLGAVGASAAVAGTKTLAKTSGAFATGRLAGWASRGQTPPPPGSGRLRTNAARLANFVRRRVPEGIKPTLASYAREKSDSLFQKVISPSLVDFGLKQKKGTELKMTDLQSMYPGKTDDELRGIAKALGVKISGDKGGGEPAPPKRQAGFTSQNI